MPASTSTQQSMASLPDDECMTRLALEEIGRVVFQQHGRWHVLPVNYAPGPDHTIVFRSARGAKVDHARRERTPVAFHLAGRTGHVAWWVTLVGSLEEVLDLTKIPALSRLEVDPWADAVKRPHWLRLQPTSMTGGQALVGAAPPGGSAVAVTATESVPAIDRGGLEILSDPQCRQLALSTPVGRLAFTGAGHPTVLPGRLLSWDDEMVLHPLTAPTGLHAGQTVAFETDAWSAPDRTGWSVLAQGKVTRIDRLDCPPPASSSGPPVRIQTHVVSGRRIVTHSDGSDQSGGR